MAGRRIAGLPAKASIFEAIVVTPSDRFRSFSSLLLKTLHKRCVTSLLRVARIDRNEKNWEQYKLKRANPSKGGDAKPPVYKTQVLRQRGYQRGRGTRASCVSSQDLRLHRGCTLARPQRHCQSVCGLLSLRARVSRASADYGPQRCEQ
jgi:hypothetical protein